VEPAIKGLFQRAKNSKALTGFEYDTETEPALRAYMESSSQLEALSSSAISKLVETQVPLLVWGAGTHTLRLLNTSALARANIRAFIDSNPRYQGKTLHGVKIISPEQATAPEATVLISSHVAQEEIKRIIAEKLRWSNPVVCLYENAPIEQPR
jgi:FlaA1/EpsC-like NDP-sugar epimerase